MGGQTQSNGARASRGRCASALKGRALDRQRELFDVWIEVQRRWVYLESIFSGRFVRRGFACARLRRRWLTSACHSGDIATLLPKETARFASANTEFVGIMRRVTKNPALPGFCCALARFSAVVDRAAAEVLAIDSLQKTLDRLLDVLKKVQKALGDYLERQRAAFPRFYFIGDDDLLEIIGNSKDLEKLQKHLRKMFAGLSALEYDAASESIVAMSSAEGERVAFVTPISLKNGPKVHEWLTRVEDSMRVALAELLQGCIAACAKLDLRAAEQVGAPRVPRRASAFTLAAAVRRLDQRVAGAARASQRARLLFVSRLFSTMGRGSWRCKRVGQAPSRRRWRPAALRPSIACSAT